MNQEFILPTVFETSESQKELAKALVKFSETMGKVAKTSNNPFFKSKYAALPDILDAIKQPMIDAGLSLTHSPCGDNTIVTVLRHISGEWQRSLFYMKSVKDTPQDRGSVITYMVRYAVGATMNLSIDVDDDGNKGTFGKQSPQQPVASQKVMTKTIVSSMKQFIDDGKIADVERKLPQYKSGKLLTEVEDYLKEAKAKK